MDVTAYNSFDPLHRAAVKDHVRESCAPSLVVKELTSMPVSIPQTRHFYLHTREKRDIYGATLTKVKIYLRIRNNRGAAD